MNISELDIKIIRELQEDFPLEPEPFKKIAKKLELDETELLERIRIMKEQGIIRRFGAALRHREVGYKANAMVVWEIAEDQVEKVGREVAKFPEVTHCYQRIIHENWPYNLFAMVHGKTKEQCYEVAKKIAEKVNEDNYKLLFSTHELKKTSMKYFVE